MVYGSALIRVADTFEPRPAGRFREPVGRSVRDRVLDDVIELRQRIAGGRVGDGPLGVRIESTLASFFIDRNRKCQDFVERLPGRSSYLADECISGDHSGLDSLDYELGAHGTDWLSIPFRYPPFHRGMTRPYHHPVPYANVGREPASSSHDTTPTRRYVR